MRISDWSSDVCSSDLPGQLPTGGIILGGIGGITTDGAGGMTINQIDPRAVITWDTFDVGVDATVVFNQAIGDIALNQIMDVDPSHIFGTITAPGTIFLPNQNGIVFGETADRTSIVSGKRVSVRVDLGG